jgi:hypothetical protein
MSKRKKARVLRVWRRYIGRYDHLTRYQPSHRGFLAPIRVTPGFFRAEGWDTDDVRSDLRHGS